jgi:hypothetical protein
MSSLTWDDLFVNAALVDFNSLLVEWPGKITGQVRLIGSSAFGDHVTTTGPSSIAHPHRKATQ